MLLIHFDDLAATAVGSYGNEIVQTPRLDRLAAQGLRFERAYAQAAMCNASRASFLTGLRPDSTRIYTNHEVLSELLPKEASTIPEAFHQAGYQTLVIGRLFHGLRRAGERVRAFDTIVAPVVPEHLLSRRRWLDPALWDEIRALGPRSHRFSSDPAEEMELLELMGERDEALRLHGADSAELAAATVAFTRRRGSLMGASASTADLQEVDGKKARQAANMLAELAAESDPRPWFFSVGFSKPHVPLLCPRSYLDLYPTASIPDPAPMPWHHVDVPEVALRFGARPDLFHSSSGLEPRMADAIQVVRSYYACTSFVDAQLGVVLDALEEHGLAEQTIVIVFSDHGFHLGEHGLFSKYTLFEEVTRVPLIVRVPGLTQPGTSTDAIVELVDLFATLAELTGIEAPARGEGSSFVPLLTDPDRPWKSAAFSVLKIRGADLDGDWVGRSMRTADWRYTEWAGPGPSEAELYDLRADPEERVNLAAVGVHRQRRVELSARLHAGWASARPIESP